MRTRGHVKAVFDDGVRYVVAYARRGPFAVTQLFGRDMNARELYVVTHIPTGLKCQRVYRTVHDAARWMRSIHGMLSHAGELAGARSDDPEVVAKAMNPFVKEADHRAPAYYKATSRIVKTREELERYDPKGGDE